MPATGLGCQPLLGRTYTSVQDDPWAVENRGVVSLAAREVLMFQITGGNARSLFFPNLLGESTVLQKIQTSRPSHLVRATNPTEGPRPDRPVPFVISSAASLLSPVPAQYQPSYPVLPARPRRTCRY